MHNTRMVDREPTASLPPAEARATLDQRGQPRALFRLERVMHARDQANERLAGPFDHGVVARELLAQHDAVERRLAQRVRDLLPAAPGLPAAELLHVAAKLLERGADRPLLRGCGVHVR